MKYQQGDRNLCLIKSLASALFYIGLRDESRHINSQSNAYKHLSLEKAYKQFQDDMKTYVPKIGVGFPYNRNFSRSRKKKEIQKMIIEDLMKNKTIYPIVIVPEGRDDDVGHTVTVVDDLIFDSTQEHALKLYRKSLEWTCGFYRIKNIYFAVWFEQQVNVPPLKCEIIYH